ncbi:unnamed protein product, partial [Symbiodinium sp. KB8]
HVVTCGCTAEGQCSLPSCGPTGREYIAVAAGQFHTLLLCADGNVLIRGLNNFGQCGAPALKAVAAEINQICEAALGKALKLIRDDGTQRCTHAYKENVEAHLLGNVMYGTLLGRVSRAPGLLGRFKPEHESKWSVTQHAKFGDQLHMKSTGV